MTQRDLSDRTAEIGFRVSHGAISKYERGVDDPTVKPLLAISLATKTNPTWYLTGSGPMQWSLRSARRDAQMNLAVQLERMAERLRGAAKDGVDLLSGVELIEAESMAVDIGGERGHNRGEASGSGDA